MKKIKKSVACLWVFCFSVLLIMPYAAAVSDSFTAGDINCDGAVTSSDARLILRISVGLEKTGQYDIKLGDINGDGIIGADDARSALQLATGISDEASAASNIENESITGYTDKGYAIYNIDGLTYIDGILIANKTYSLSEGYDPGELLSECTEAFNKMKRDAAQQGLNIYISSGYRSYSSQKSIYNRYVYRDGKALADTYSARPGHSEHQTGLAIDLNTITRSFGYTAEGRWVAAHCHEYGFILRYPEGTSHITGYCYEPWHLRYVGIEKATAIAESGMCLEEYYGFTSQY